MDEKIVKFNTTVKGIEFKMLRKNDNCWIKIEPVNRISTPSSLHIILNGESHQWEVYDESGKETHKIYFKGYKITPSFYLKLGEKCYRIDFGKDKIHVIPITETHTKDAYIKNNCNFATSLASCWATAIYYSKRPDKPPFDEM